MTTLFCALVMGFQAVPTKPVTCADLAKFDKKTVKVVGKIDKYEERTAKTSKNPYTVFVLVDAKGKVNIYLKGRPGVKVKNGDKVQVTGTYSLEKKIGSRVFKNEIDASNDKIKTNGVKPVK